MIKKLLAICLSKNAKWCLAFLMAAKGGLVFADNSYMEVLLGKAVKEVQDYIDLTSSNVFIAKGRFHNDYCSRYISNKDHSYVVFFTPSVLEGGAVTLGGDACVLFDKDFEVEDVYFGE